MGQKSKPKPVHTFVEPSKDFKRYIFVAIPIILLAITVANYMSSYDAFQDITRYDIPWNNNETQRIVAVGDLHGDLENSLKTMVMAGLINPKGNWIAGNTIFVQTGDIVDRGDDTIALYKLMIRLREEALKAGGMVIPILGNHEVLNLAHQWEYVTEGDVISFGGRDARQKAWSKTGWIGKYLRKLGIGAIVNGTVFFHGGANPEWALKTIHELNTESLYELSKPPLEIQKAPIFGEGSVIWYRGYAQQPEYQICNVLDSALKKLNARRV